MFVEAISNTKMPAASKMSNAGRAPPTSFSWRGSIRSFEMTGLGWRPGRFSRMCFSITSSSDRDWPMATFGLSAATTLTVRPREMSFTGNGTYASIACGYKADHHIGN